MIVGIALGIAGCKTAKVVGGPVDTKRLEDGTYKGSASFGPNKVRVSVTILDQRIVQVDILEHDAWKGHKADETIPKRIVEKQSTRVDAVTGATNSSNVIMNAAQNAIEKSYDKTDNGTGETE